MLKKTIVFEDYNGKEVTEDFYFNLTKAELVELQLSSKQGFSETLQAIIKAEDNQQILNHFKQIILLAVGQKSEDGRRFVKNQDIRDDFAQTEAYSQFFVELATDAKAAAAFINGIVPTSMAKEVEAEVAQRQATLDSQADISEVLPTTPTTEASIDLDATEAPIDMDVTKPTDEEILKMKPKDMNNEQLRRAFALRNSQA